jgi:hypothetical protein
VKAFQHVLQENSCTICDAFIAKGIGVGPRNSFKDVFKRTKTPFNERIIERLVTEKRKLN